MTSHRGAQIKLEEGTGAMSSTQINLQAREQSIQAGENNAMVVRRKEGEKPERLISDEMGSEVVTLWIGDNQTVFNIHKALIQSTSAFFDDIFKGSPTPGQRITLSDEDPSVFKLFVEFLYTKRVPAVTSSMAPPTQALRTKHLCQFYAFCDRFHLKFEIRNRIMDRIQDAFFIMGKFPEPGLVQAIYINSVPKSKLRHFAIAGLYYWFRSAENIKDEDFKALLRNNDEVLEDFLTQVRSDSASQDPRIRQCHGWEGCAECADHPLGHACIEGLGGIFPCEFHIHKGIIARIKEDPNGPLGSNTEDVEHVDDGCYCWSVFPDMPWMERYVLKID